MKYIFEYAIRDKRVTEEEAIKHCYELLEKQLQEQYKNVSTVNQDVCEN
jgi:hypothetical protein